jgi:hypothetical protein
MKQCEKQHAEQYVKHHVKHLAKTSLSASRCRCALGSLPSASVSRSG